MGNKYDTAAWACTLGVIANIPFTFYISFINPILLPVGLGIEVILMVSAFKFAEKSEDNRP